MKKTAALLSLLLCVSLLLSGCARGAGGLSGGVRGPAHGGPPAGHLQYGDGSAGRAGHFLPPEESEEPEQPAQSYTQAAAVPRSRWSRARYAGSTHPLNPVDMPTPTPRPDVTFEYETYQAAIGYSFEAPVRLGDHHGRQHHLRPDRPETRDGVNGQITITVQKVDSGYRVNQLRTELNNQLSEIKRNYVEFSQATMTGRPLLKYDGYYNTYRGVTYDGIIVRGLMHMCLAERRIVTLSFRASGWYNTSYTRVYNRIKNTIK